jgi:hypothetical protein
VPPGLRSLIVHAWRRRWTSDLHPRELGERLGLPDADLPTGTEDAADVVGSAAAAEVSVDDRPAAPPRWPGGTDPTPTPMRVTIVPKGHLHWAWVPGFGAVVLAVVAVLYGIVR